MTPRGRVIGVGQRAAGDDAVGLAVASEVARLAPDVECHLAGDAMAIVPLLATTLPVVVVDAVLAAPPGQVLVLALDDVQAGAAMAMSSHGLGVRQAIELARVTEPETTAREVSVVAVTIARPGAWQDGLGPDVAQAVPHAARQVLALLDAVTRA